MTKESPLCQNGAVAQKELKNEISYDRNMNLSFVQIKGKKNRALGCELVVLLE